MSERTEQATDYHLEQLRERGQVVRSQDLMSASALALGFWLLQSIAPSIVTQLHSQLAGGILDLASPDLRGDLTFDRAGDVLTRGGSVWLQSVLPLLAALPLLGIGLSFAQGVVFSPKVLWSGWSRLNPLSGFQRLFSSRALVDTLRAAIKVAVVLWAAYGAVLSAAGQLPWVVGSSDTRQISSFIGSWALGVGQSGALALLALAVLDFVYQRWSYFRNARMSVEDVKREYKEHEGNPIVKSYLRRRQLEMVEAAAQLDAVPQATGVITNPTHVAVAFRYDRGMHAPTIVAKGTDGLARHIKAIARARGIPVVENPPLARVLFALCEVGEEIPAEVYEAVAGVLAYIYRLQERRRRRFA